jgi:hypothetical protein
MEKRICIVSCPLSTDKGEVFKMKRNDTILTNEIKRYVNEQNDIEVFEQQNNIVATNNGFVCAFYEDDLKHA